MRYSESGLVINTRSGYILGGKPVTIAGLTPNRARKPSPQQRALRRRLDALDKRIADLGPRIDRLLADAVASGALPAVGEPLQPGDDRPVTPWGGHGGQHASDIRTHAEWKAYHDARLAARADA